MHTSQRKKMSNFFPVTLVKAVIRKKLFMVSDADDLFLEQTPCTFNRKKINEYMRWRHEIKLTGGREEQCRLCG